MPPNISKLNKSKINIFVNSIFIIMRDLKQNIELNFMINIMLKSFLFSILQSMEKSVFSRRETAQL